MRQSSDTGGLDSLLKQLPNDEDRIRLLKTLSESDGQMPIAQLASRLEKNSADAAKLVVGAAKDGLVDFLDDGRVVKISDFGAKLVRRFSGSAY